MLVGGGPTGVELAGTLAEIARQTLRDEFRSIDTARARIVLVEAGPTILPAFPEKLRDAARALAAAARHRGSRGRRRHRDRRARRDGSGANAWTRARSCGRPASPPRRSSRRSVCRSIAPAACWSKPDLSIPGHPEVFVVGDAAAFLHQGGKPLPGVAQTAMQGAAHAARTILDRVAGRAHDSRSSTATTATWRSSAAARRLPTSAGLQFSGPIAWLAVAVPPHLHAHRFPQSRRRLRPVGGRPTSRFSAACGSSPTRISSTVPEAPVFATCPSGGGDDKVACSDSRSQQRSAPGARRRPIRKRTFARRSTRPTCRSCRWRSMTTSSIVHLKGTVDSTGDRTRAEEVAVGRRRHQRPRAQRADRERAQRRRRPMTSTARSTTR